MGCTAPAPRMRKHLELDFHCGFTFGDDHFFQWAGSVTQWQVQVSALKGKHGIIPRWWNGWDLDSHMNSLHGRVKRMWNMPVLLQPAHCY